jgi:predicted DNA-binding transcriptional regulator YafY
VPASGPVHTKHAAADDTVVAAAVRAMRAGDRSAASRPEAAPPVQLGRSASPEIITELRRALGKGATLWIGYVDNHGASSERVIDPVRLEGGWLTAFDHRSGEVRSFAVHRISGVHIPATAGPAE